MSAHFISFEHFFLPGRGWRQNEVFEVDSCGRIVAQGVGLEAQAERTSFYDIGMPGIANQHSHTYQLAMAGLSEHLQSQQVSDHFWSWRQRLYELALRVRPEEVRALALACFRMMAARGYTSFKEFHYLHHQPDGKPYARPFELALQIIDAAHEVGVDLLMVPVYYRKANFDQKGQAQQRRFLFKSLSSYWQLVEDLESLVKKSYPRARLGQGVHSLRAASQEEVREILDHPVREAHIHISEQTKEVEDCLAVWGKRPVEWLLDEIPLGPKHHLVHATHMDAAEVQRLAQTAAKVILCPSTEANLGDGFFALRSYHEAGGSWGLGSDSQVGLDPFEELRWLDYGLRLQEQKRNPLATSQSPDSYEALLTGALNTDGSSDLVGRPASFVALSQQSDLLGQPLSPEQILSQKIFAPALAPPIQVILFGQPFDAAPAPSSH